MSLYDLSKDLENVSDQNLMQMSQDPTAMYPQFLVLAEVQRRNQVRQRYETELAKQQQPQTTVSEEVMMEFAGQSPMPEAESPMQQMAMQEEMPVQQMASGGLTSYQEGGSTALEQSFVDYIKENPLEAASYASMLIPGLGLAGLGARGALGAYRAYKGSQAAGKVLPGLRSMLQKTYTRKNPKLADDVSMKYGTRRVDRATGATIQPRVFDPVRTAAGLGSVPFLATQVAQMEDIEDIDDSGGIPRTGLEGISKAKADPLDIAQIGFAIASARNPSELGTGLQQIAAGMSERRMAEKDQMFKNLMIQYELAMSKATLESEQLGDMTPETAMNLKRLEDAIEQLSGIDLGQSQDEEMLAMTSVT